MSPLASQILFLGSVALVLTLAYLADRAQVRARRRLAALLEICTCRTDRNTSCPSHGVRGQRVGVDVHAVACFDDGRVDDWSCRCGLIRTEVHA